nr:hypothetical protein [Tanacetum cinerariifolium]
MMSLATFPLFFWDYALESAARILNMVPTKKADKTPYELWHGKVPNLSYLKVWGYEAHVKRHTPDKLQQRSVKDEAYVKCSLCFGCRIHYVCSHWTAVKNILKYLRNTKDTFLVYGGDLEAELRVNCYCDVGFETDRDDTKSQTGKFIDEIGIVPSNDYLIKMNCDNSTTTIMANESRIQKGARHFKRKYHNVRKYVETGEIDIVKVHTDDNLADLFTKALAGPKLTRHARSMGLRPASSFM